MTGSCLGDLYVLRHIEIFKVNRYLKIAVVSLTAETIVDTHYGLGLHLANFDFSWFIPYLKLFFSTEISYHVSMSFIKASILSFYLRFREYESYHV